MTFPTFNIKHVVLRGRQESKKIIKEELDHYYQNSNLEWWIDEEIFINQLKRDYVRQV